MAKKTDLVQVTTYAPSALAASIQAIATQERRSLSSQVLVLLEQAIANRNREADAVQVAR